LQRTKAGLLPAFDGIHAAGFFGLLAVSRQCPLLPLKSAVETVEKPFQRKKAQKISHFMVKNGRNLGLNCRKQVIFDGFLPLSGRKFLQGWFFDSLVGWLSLMAKE